MYKVIQKPVKYDGRTPWESYLAQFDIASQINGWDEEEKAAFLATSLTGPALAVLGNLTAEKRTNYKALVSAFTARFGSTHQAELARVRFKSRTRGQDESLPELAEDIERLGRLAYPDAPDQMTDSLSLDQFVDALHDDDTRLRLRQNCPKTLREAVELALELESFLRSSRQRVRQVHAIEDPVRRVQGEGATRDSGGATQNDDGQKLVQQITEAIQAALSASPFPRRQGCYLCGEMVHFKRDCPKSKGGQPEKKQVN